MRWRGRDDRKGKIRKDKVKRERKVEKVSKETRWNEMGQVKMKRQRKRSKKMGWDETRKGMEKVEEKGWQEMKRRK